MITNNDKLRVLIINDMVIFPNNEVRIEYDNIFDKNVVDILENTEGENILIVNPLDEGFKSNVTSLLLTNCASPKFSSSEFSVWVSATVWILLDSVET